MAPTFNPDTSLNVEQQALLRSALASNKPPVNSVNNQSKPSASPSSMAHGKPNGSASAANSNIDPARAYPSPDDLQQSLPSGKFDEGPLLDFGFDDGNFDWENNDESLDFGDNTHLEDDHPEHDEKRKHPDSDDDDQEGSHKRLESEDKASKKPGRKPIIGEPTTKRKAQNRAAQRAFRERKERHLKDLETKVEHLEKASESANHENGRLRSEVDRLNNEVKEYKKRLSVDGVGARTSPTAYSQTRIPPTGINDFQFNFPKFGDLPGSSFMNSGSLARTSSTSQVPSNPQRSASGSIPPSNRTMSSSSINANGAFSGNMTEAPVTQSPIAQNFQSPSSGITGQSSGDLSDLFSPSILESARRSASIDYMGNSQVPPLPMQSKKESTGSSREYMNTLNMKSGSTGSPSASSMSYGGLNSSCDTTPEPSNMDSPNRKQSEGLSNGMNDTQNSTLQAPTSFLPLTDTSTTTSPFPTLDFLAQQNNNAFDPVLFETYRSPQDSILQSTQFPSSTANTFTDFFNDPFYLNPNDFNSPYNTGANLTGEPDTLQSRSMAAMVPPNVDSSGKKMDLMRQVEEAQQAYDDPAEAAKQSENEEKERRENEEAIKKMQKPTFVPCDKLWDRVQTSALARSGEVDMDDLCLQLKSKARCSGNGAVIDTVDVDKILGPPPEEQIGAGGSGSGLLFGGGGGSR